MTHSKVDGNGFEYIVCCVKCKLDKNGICDGVKISVDIDNKKQTSEIIKMVGAKYVETLAKFKDDVFSEYEFKKWLAEHGYEEDESECEKSRARLKQERGVG